MSGLISISETAGNSDHQVALLKCLFILYSSDELGRVLGASRFDRIVSSICSSASIRDDRLSKIQRCAVSSKDVFKHFRVLLQDALKCVESHELLNQLLEHFAVHLSEFNTEELILIDTLRWNLLSKSG